MKTMKTLILLFSFVMHATVQAKQIPTATINGTKDDRNTTHAFIHAHIFLDHKKQLNDAILIIKNNKVLDVGKNISIPSDAIIHDLQGANIYPGFILMDSDYGLPEVPKKVPFTFFGKEVLASTTTGAVNTNEAIKASYKAILDFHHDSKKAKELRKNGFSMVLSSKHDGIMRGSSVLVNLNDEHDQQSIINSNQSFHLSFDKGSSKQIYPISLMGASALLRQTWLDAQWYANGKDGFTDLDLQAVNDNNNTIQIFSVKNWQQALLAHKITQELDKKIILKTAGDEYKHIDAINKLNTQLIVPLAFPAALAVSDELDAWNVSYEKMLQWQAAPYNLYYLHNKGIEFAIIPDKQKSFLKDLRKAVKMGLPESAALAALTATPAKMLQHSNIGHLHRGASANFIITDGNIFSKTATIAENWIAGKRYIIKGLPKVTPGVYELQISGKLSTIEVTNKDGKINFKNTDKDSKTKYKVKTTNDFISIEITDDDKASKLLGLLKPADIGNIKGQTPLWRMTRTGEVANKEDKKTKEQLEQIKPPIIPQPFSAYGIHKPPTDTSFLITNTTVWTNEEDGIVKATDVLIDNGKIVKIGKNLSAKSATKIDGTGKHLTSGIIDEHSHIALLSVNDIAVNSAMVRMQDALDSDDVNIYRNLSGGVTAAQLLHGSANPLGGQSAIIKMRWGATSDELLIQDADKFIKFALGENVKRSASQNSIRYPLTRMGVEQVYRDAFNNALVYEEQWRKYNKLSKRAKKQTPAPRRDLMLDATLEVINQDRFVTCHSYVQSEINMLMKVADDYNFRLNTFTHILEGYKVADKMRAHGVGASSFSDWWAYKWEVNYAIPYNPAILVKMGVTTAINSDDPEMARRLNQEAAKSIKYGDLTEEQAWKLVTLNPAKLLRLDGQMGSIKVGKDADIVLWNDNPLSIYALAEKTFVDGKLLFDRSRHIEIETAITQARGILIAALNKADEPKIPALDKPKKHMQCDSITGYEYLTGAVQ
ncbi:MAG: amidohydrolase family protein [Proteobacteria bacterium]|nr:amidohydrolase family protein [Pseudomonadota bacterium]